MIIKKNLKSVMPSLKRCRIAVSGGDDEESYRNRKKRKANNDFYPLHLLGDVAARVIPFSGYGLQRILGERGSGRPPAAAAAVSWCTEVSCSPGVAESELKGNESCQTTAQEAPRPPLVRTSRGRVQVLPSRFNDSVLDNWKKDRTKGSVKESDPEFNPYKEKTSAKNSKLRGDIVNKKYKVNHQCSKFSSVLEDEIEDIGPPGYNVRKYSSSRSSLTSLTEQYAEIGEMEEPEDIIDLSGIGEFAKEEVKRKGQIYGPDDFVSGDVVWAISGRHSPAWPAIVLDPEIQAPQQVLNFRVADAVCVMFFGYSGNGTQRVSLSFLSYVPQ